MSLRAALLIGLAVFGTALPALGQEAPATRVVTIVNADSTVGAVVDGQRLRHLFGNVHLRQDDTDLRARRATQYLDRDLTVFEGDVRIYDATDTLRADRVGYDSRTRVGEARGGVRLSDAEAVLYSDSLVYYRSEKRAVFRAPVRLIEREGGGILTSLRGTYFTERKEAFFEENVRLEDSTSVLTSHRGRYGTEDKRADFSGDVHLTHERSTRMRADSLTHFRDSRISEARGRVAVLRLGGREADQALPDTTRRTLLFGGYGYHDESLRYSRVEQGDDAMHPLVARLRTDANGATDTLLVRAIVFEATQPDSLAGAPVPEGAALHRVFGRGAVRLAGQQIAAVADSTVVDRIEFDNAEDHPPEDDIRLYRAPMAWLNSRGSTVYTQISADSLRLSARGEAVDTLRAFGRAFAARPDSVLERNNQIRGRQMLALFREDTLRAIRVWPNAEALFFRADSLDQLEGAIRLSGDSLSFTFEGDELRRMSGVRDIEGTYYDAEILPPGLALEGPEYHPDLRPTIAELLEGRPPLIDPFIVPQPPPLAGVPADVGLTDPRDVPLGDSLDPPPDLPEDDDGEVASESDPPEPTRDQDGDDEDEVER